jgi:hypothetical protein
MKQSSYFRQILTKRMVRIEYNCYMKIVIITLNTIKDNFIFARAKLSKDNDAKLQGLKQTATPASYQKLLLL